MSEEANQWLDSQLAGRQTSSKPKARSTWRLCETIARLADQRGVFTGGVPQLARKTEFSERYVRQLLDVLEAGEVISRIPRYGRKHGNTRPGRLTDAIVIGGWTEQKHRKPMRRLPEALRVDDEQ